MPPNVRRSSLSDLQRDAHLRRHRDFFRRVSSASGIDAADADSLLRLYGVQHVLEVRDEAESRSDPADPEGLVRGDRVWCQPEPGWTNPDGSGSCSPNPRCLSLQRGASRSPSAAPPSPSSSGCSHTSRNSVRPSCGRSSAATPSSTRSTRPAGLRIHPYEPRAHNGRRARAAR